MAIAKNGADRVKASRLRAKRDLAEEDDTAPELTRNEEAWLNAYEASESGAANSSASASERVVHIEERSAAQAQGDHPHPDAYAAIATAEGLRADTLLRIATNALIESNNQHRLLAEMCLRRTEAVEAAHVNMLEAIRESHLARISAEGEARMAELAEGLSGGDDELAEMLKFGMAAWANAQKNGPPSKRSKVKKKATKAKKSSPLGSVD